MEGFILAIVSQDISAELRFAPLGTLPSAAVTPAEDLFDSNITILLLLPLP